MTFIDIFFIGIGLALDACCVCTSNGLAYRPNVRRAVQYSLVFAIFQGVMPLLGYLGVGILEFKLFEYNSFIALILLSIIGGKMIYEALGEKKDEETLDKKAMPVMERAITGSILFVQGVSTSIDALSVGITFYNYTVEFVMCAAILIASITWGMCFASFRIGRKIGTRLNAKAGMIGGMVLILLGVKIFLVG